MSDHRRIQDVGGAQDMPTSLAAAGYVGNG